MEVEIASVIKEIFALTYMLYVYYITCVSV